MYKVFDTLGKAWYYINVVREEATRRKAPVPSCQTIKNFLQKKVDTLTLNPYYKGCKIKRNKKDKGITIMKYYSTLDHTATFLQENAKLIDGVKITRLDVGQFNEMEGYQYDFNLKVNTIDGYKNKLINVHTNSTWVDDLYEYDDDGNRLDTELSDRQALTDYLSNQLF